MTATLERPKAIHRLWTPAEDAIIRQYYDSKVGCVKKVARMLPGRTTKAVNTRAGTLRVIYRSCRPWAEDDDERLVSLAARYPHAVIARLMNRTEEAVSTRLHRLNFKTNEAREWYTQHDTARICGVHESTVRRWGQKGWLKYTYHHGKAGDGLEWHITREGLREFIRRYPTELGQQVDVYQMIDILAGVLGSAGQGEEEIA